MSRQQSFWIGISAFLWLLVWSVFRTITEEEFQGYIGLAQHYSRLMCSWAPTMIISCERSVRKDAPSEDIARCSLHYHYSCQQS